LQVKIKRPLKQKLKTFFSGLKKGLSPQSL
jgi:hypothetical protein